MYKINTYPDGGKYIEVIEPQQKRTYRINSYEDLFLLKSLKDADPLFEEVFIPCMFQQQHDRRFADNQSFELKLICDFINSCNFKLVTVFHPHSDVTPALLNNCKVLSNAEFIKNVLQRESINQDLILFSSDANGYKSLTKLANEIDWKGEIASANKYRLYLNGESKIRTIIPETDFDGCDILIIDDICVFGGTFIELAKQLRERNVGKLYLAVSHLTSLNPNPELFKLFDGLFTTNSKWEQPHPNFITHNLF